MMKDKWLRLIECHLMWRGEYQVKRRVNLTQKGFDTLARKRMKMRKRKEESTMQRRNGGGGDGGGDVDSEEW